PAGRAQAGHSGLWQHAGAAAEAPAHAAARHCQAPRQGARDRFEDRVRGTAHAGEALKRLVGRSFARFLLPQAHHAAFRTREERNPAHARHFLLLDVDLASRLDDLPAIRCKIVDGDIEEHVAGPRPITVRLHDTAIDATLAAGIDDAVVQL